MCYVTLHTTNYIYILAMLMKDSNIFKITYLELAFPPISNQEAVTFKKGPHERFMKDSDFYMIAGKAEASFCNPEIISTHEIYVEIRSDDKIVTTGTIDFNTLKCPEDLENISKRVMVGPKEIATTSYPDENGVYFYINRLTPESILWFRSRQTEGIRGFDNYRDLMVYDLLYTGIAKVGDTYDRLIKNGHHARTDILSNEKQRSTGARVSEEIFIFMFRLEPLFISSFGGNSDVDLNFGYDHKKIVADAEKAFVSLLQPEYNKERFKKYPIGKDGLYDSKLDSYAYLIAETLTFNTPSGSFSGGQNNGYWNLYNDADVIFTDKKTTTILTSDS